LCREYNPSRILNNLKDLTDLDAIRKEIDQEYTSAAVTPLFDVLKSYTDIYIERQERLAAGGAIGLSTGVRWLDEGVGLLSHQLITIAGRPRMGKSSFAMNVALWMARKKHKVLFIGLEMSEDEVMTRAIASSTGVPMDSLKKTTIENIFESTGRFYDEHPTMSFYFPRRFTSFDALALLSSYDAIVIDQLSNLTDERGKNENKALYYGDVTNRLKNAAMQSGKTVFLCAQINRAGADEPTLENLKDSGCIEENSDIVLILHQPDPMVDDIRIVCAKNRSGRDNHYLDFKFNKSLCRFIPINTSDHRVG